MRKLIIILFFGASISLHSQLLELDYRSPVKKESLLKARFIKTFVGGINTLGHVDVSSEVININYSSSSGFVGGISVVGTYPLFLGNKDDKKNNLSHLLNPLGGINGSLYFQFPLQQREKTSFRLSTRMGLKWIEGHPLRGFERYFLSGYGMLGGVYQRLLYENAPENERIDFWAYPHLMANQVKPTDLEVFFDNALESITYGYGLQSGVEFNQKWRIVFLLNQLVNTTAPDAVGGALLRLTLGYRF